jgi:hypothetical protein
MKIAQIAPLMESVPPRLYGGTERIVSYLTEELVRLGHEVTLFASADRITAAELVGCASVALRLDGNEVWGDLSCREIRPVAIIGLFSHCGARHSGQEKRLSAAIRQAPSKPSRLSGFIQT